jgi:cell wall-associated NlpC family hydrolase
MSFERAADRRVNGVATRSEQRIVRARAAAADGGDSGGEPVQPAPEKGYVDSNGLAVAPSSAPDEVKAIIDAGNRIATKPYKYGGGHGRWNDSGYDCSGSVSYVLHAAGLLSRALDSSQFMSWGEAGRGTWITIRTNPSHAYMIVAGLRFDTSARSQTGSRWSEQMRSARGFRGRHPEGF